MGTHTNDKELHIHTYAHTHREREREREERRRGEREETGLHVLWGYMDVMDFLLYELHLKSSDAKASKCH